MRKQDGNHNINFKLPLLGLGFVQEYNNWPKTAEQALLSDTSDNDNASEDGREMGTLLCRKLNSCMKGRHSRRISYRYKAAKLRKTLPYTPSTFKRLIWSKLTPAEKIYEPKGSRKAYKAELYSLQRIAHLVGSMNLASREPRGSRAFIAPKAYATSDWYDEQVSTATAPALKLELGDYVAVLMEFYGFCYGWKFGEKNLCKIAGVEVLGEVGVFPRAVISYCQPFEIHYSPNTMSMAISYTYFPFNSCGMYQNSELNGDFIREVQGQQPPAELLLLANSYHV